MPYKRTEQPPFSWSHSRQRVLDTCARQYYWRYYRAHNGWEANAPREVRTAWTLKQLTTYPLVLGGAVHAQAQRVAAAVRDRQPLPEYEALRNAARGTLNGLFVQCRRRSDFIKAPSRFPITIDAYYGRVTPPQLFERLRARLSRCLTNLLDQPLWDELAALPPHAIRVVDALTTVEVDGVRVYVAPDLIFRTPSSGWVIVDWKTGSAAGAEAQLALYALYLHETMRLEASGARYEGRIIDLRSGQATTHQIGASDLAAARARVGGGVARMHRYLRDIRRNVALPSEAFPLAPDRRVCGHCAFRALCPPAPS